MPADKPIAGVDLEAEQVVREDKEKPVKIRKIKLRKAYLIFGGIVIAQTILLVIVFGQISGSDPDKHQALAETFEEALPMLDEATLEELGGMGVLAMGDVSIFEPSIDQPGRSLETTIVALQVGVSQEAWTSLAAVFEANPAAKELIVMDLRDHVRSFMSMYGGENLSHRQEAIDDDLLRYFRELSRDSVGGLSRQFTKVGFDKVKSVLR
jgi:hypothetical protein